MFVAVTDALVVKTPLPPNVIFAPLVVIAVVPSEAAIILPPNFKSSAIVTSSAAKVIAVAPVEDLISLPYTVKSPSIPILPELSI